ncbi:MAG: DUF86 domain-containing protein [Lewinella sp.]|nr:DUF86 domain-containing protein [Lewinella sp.]
MKEKPPDDARIRHILDAISEIEVYVKEIEFSFFETDSKTKFASIKQLEIIGEAVYHLTDKLKSQFPEIQWKAIEALRHILVHDYYAIQDDILWRIIQTHLPIFKSGIEEIARNLT